MTDRKYSGIEPKRFFAAYKKGQPQEPSKMSERPPRVPIVPSVVWAVVIAVVIGLWMVSGIFAGHTPPDEATAAKDAAEENGAPAFRVRAQTSVAREKETSLTVRGRTQAIRAVEIRAETTGRVVALPIEKGSRVAAEDVVCELSLDARDAELAEARALVDSKALEWKASKSLVEKGHRSETSAAAARAEYDAALAQLRIKQVAVENTKIRAPFDGILDQRPVEIGDYMQAGTTCGLIVDQDPFLVVGQVSESEVVKLKVGTPGTARLADGRIFKGTIRFIATSADEATRTFRVELEVPNPDGELRDGLTASVTVPTGTSMAHLVSPAILGLDEHGEIGVRTVDERGAVTFQPVHVLSDTKEGVWITGLPSTATLITVGQDFVVPGQIVEVELEQPAPEIADRRDVPATAAD